MTSRPPYRGPSRRLVLAFDVGTTFSGVSYSILDPGHVPEIKGVTRFPYQDSTGGDFKVPSIIWYDANGEVRAIGAGAVRDGIEQDAEDEQWTKVEWFKLSLRPKTLNTDEVSRFIEQIPPLPAGKTLVDVFADYYRFLYESSRAYIEDNYSTGRSIWASVQSDIIFVLSHPNGWEGPEQSRLRRAAVLAGLVPDTDEGRDRIHFVTEGEASLHFCINQGLMTERIKTESNILVVDAGGGTIDTSTYRQRKDKPGSFYELAIPNCKLRGSIFVTQYARKYLEEQLCDSSFMSVVPDIVKCFDKTTKLHFRQIKDPAFIKFGTSRDNEPAHNIRSGQLKLQGETVATFFQSSVDSITDVILQHHWDHGNTAVFLVGGFSASDWLFKTVESTALKVNIEVSRPSSQSNKAVADGAASFYVDHFVSRRISRFSYGVSCHTEYDPQKADHLARRDQKYIALDGKERISGAFATILPKGSIVNEEKGFYSPFRQLGKNKVELRRIASKIYRYQGSWNRLNWKDQDPDNLEVMCIVEADTSVASAALLPLQRKMDGQTYYELDYKLVLQFGLTEFKAQLCWDENGVEKRSPARAIYETD
ncbi:hypothetical protein BDN72DRAFT_902221 [Pluteus cervinus]|uniref:Uncharacterized protein n=1 Tax=Pluteus cervinus TaxID=181527 RepID=A0ACD3AFP8_9AGAR|nr:hypothetical protein BDN72DRAFT_902221 [Pluteus cervinus]